MFARQSAAVETKVLGASRTSEGDGQIHLEALAPMSALCTIARFRQTPADPATLAHQLGLKANLTRSTPQRLALMRSSDDGLHVVVLARSDGQQVLLQDFAQGATGRPTIEHG